MINLRVIDGVLSFFKDNGICVASGDLAQCNTKEEAVVEVGNHRNYRDNYVEFTRHNHVLPGKLYVAVGWEYPDRFAAMWGCTTTFAPILLTEEKGLSILKSNFGIKAERTFIISGREFMFYSDPESPYIVLPTPLAKFLAEEGKTENGFVPFSLVS